VVTGSLAAAAQCTDPAVVGGKAARLAELVKLGLPVPPFIVIPASSAGAIGDGVLDGELVREIDAFLATIDQHGRFAVRSSAVGEDAAGSSHAGQFESVIGVRRPAVYAAIRQVAVSASRATAAQYRERIGLRSAAVPMAIIVQVLVEARAAGVAFTVDPVTGAPTQVVVAALGLGGGVVQDQVPSDTYRRPFGAFAWDRTIAVKSERIVPSNDADGVRVENTPHADARQPALSRLELEELGEALARIGDAAIEPQDVEWAVDDRGQLWIVQARPATAVPGPPLEAWDASNVCENYPGFTGPLTFSLAQRTYRELYDRAILEVRGLHSGTAGSRRSPQPMLGVIRGRLYLNLTSYYAIFDSVPGLENTVGAWRAALGIEDQAGPAARSSGIFRRAGTWLRLARRYLANDRQVADCVNSSRAIVATAVRAEGGAGSAALLDAFGRLRRELLPRWTAMIFNDFFLFLLLERLSRRAADGDGTLQRLLAGVGGKGMASLAVADSLRGLAERALGIPGAVELLGRSGDDREAWDELLRLDGDGCFRATLTQHLDRHGDRGIGELKLETLTPAETPWTLMPLLRRVAATPLSRHAGELEAAAKASGLSAFRARWRTADAGVLAGHLLSRCRAMIIHRENLSSARAQAYGAMRRLFRALGYALVAEGHLDEVTQVFDLLLEDLEEFAAGGMPPRTLTRLAQIRRRQYTRWAAEPAPPHRIVFGSVARVAPPPLGRAGLRGIPCSIGIVTAPVRVIFEPTGAETLLGEILVAPTTELGWLPLLLQASDLIIERGSILSHAAIIAREIGLPTIVAVPDATTRLRDGDVVEMDGATGTIFQRR
jgi:pyruvate,water dikinase